METITSILDLEVPGFAKSWHIFESLSMSPQGITFVATGIVPMLWFYLYGLFLFVVDMFASQSFINQYKVQSSARPTHQQYWKAVQVTLFNWTVLGLPYMYVLTHFLMPHKNPSIPTIYIFLRDMAVFVVLEELLFYASHRLLHQPHFYAPIHKFHHTYTAPFGIAALYAHPIEHILSNVMPVSAGPLLMKSHPLVSMLWGLLALFNTMTVHSGYDLSSLLMIPAPYFHDWHHEKFTENYGVGLGLDYLLGTSRSYLVAISKGQVFIPRIREKST